MGPTRLNPKTGSAGSPTPFAKRLTGSCSINTPPSGVVVNSDLEVIQFRGSTSAYLEPMPGKASFHIFKMAREGLLMPLRATVHKARKENRPARHENIVVRVGDQSEKIVWRWCPFRVERTGLPRAV